MYGALHFLFSLIIGCYFPSFHAQVLHLHKLSQKNCHTNCEHGLINDLDYCNTFVTVQFNDTIPDTNLVYFEIIGEVPENLFSIDIPSECTGYKQNAKYYCTQVENNYFNITVFLYAKPKFSKAQFRSYLTTPKGIRIESGILTFPEVQDARNAKAKLLINGVDITTEDDCFTKTDTNNLDLAIDCSSGATPCFIEIQLNDSVVYKRIGNHGVYTKSMESKEELFINISYAACSLERNFKSITCRIEQDSKDDIKQTSTSNDTITIVSCSIVFGLLFIAVIFYIILRKKVNRFCKQIICRDRKTKRQRYHNEDKPFESAPFLSNRKEDTSESKSEENAKTVDERDTSENKSEESVKTVDERGTKVLENAPRQGKTVKELTEKFERVGSFVAKASQERDKKEINVDQIVAAQCKTGIKVDRNAKAQGKTVDQIATGQGKTEIKQDKNDVAEDKKGAMATNLVINNSNDEKPALESIDLILKPKEEDLDASKISINNGADDKQAENYKTALMIACEKGQYSLCLELIGKGADVNEQNTSKTTALMIACKNGFENIVGLLIEKEADLEKKNFSGHTALIIACKHGHHNIAEMLIKGGADVNSTDAMNSTPLIAACEIGHCDLVSLLIENRARIKSMRDDGMTALRIAEINGNEEICTLIRGKMVSET